MRSDAFLQELKATLFLSDPEQLLGPPLIGCKASHLPDEIPHELIVLGQLALGIGWLSLNKKHGSCEYYKNK